MHDPARKFIFLRWEDHEYISVILFRNEIFKKSSVDEIDYLNVLEITEGNWILM